MTRWALIFICALGGSVWGLLGAPSPKSAQAHYRIDTLHAALIFRVKHFGLGHFYGRFNGITGKFSASDPAGPGDSVEVEVDATSVDTANQERDDHLRGPDFLDVKQFSTIRFKSKTVEAAGPNKLRIAGDFSLHGVTKAITVEADLIGAGKDPRGQFRMGWETTFSIKRGEYGITYGPEALGEEIRITLAVEGVRR